MIWSFWATYHNIEGLGWNKKLPLSARGWSYLHDAGILFWTNRMIRWNLQVRWPKKKKRRQSDIPKIWQSQGVIWMFPKIVVPPNHPISHRVFHYKPSILGVPLFLETPILGFAIRIHRLCVFCSWTRPVLQWRRGAGQGGRANLSSFTGQVTPLREGVTVGCVNQTSKKHVLHKTIGNSHDFIFIAYFTPGQFLKRSGHIFSWDPL